jgi:hypothetical protein
MEAHAELLAHRDPSTAARMLGVAARLRQTLNRPVSSAAAAIIDRIERRCQGALGGTRFAREHRRGGQLHPADLIERLDAA